MQLAHHPTPKPDNTGPFTPALLKEAVTSVDGLSKSIREFPETWHRHNNPDWVLAGIALILGLLFGLAIANTKRKGT